MSARGAKIKSNLRQARKQKGKFDLSACAFFFKVLEFIDYIKINAVETRVENLFLIRAVVSRNYFSPIRIPIFNDIISFPERVFLC